MNTLMVLMNINRKKHIYELFHMRTIPVKFGYVLLKNIFVIENAFRSKLSIGTITQWNILR